jgi:hypothetical protein
MPCMFMQVRSAITESKVGGEALSGKPLFDRWILNFKIEAT